MEMKPSVKIEYCTGCRWLLRASWTAQELLTTFESELASVTLKPAEVAGAFIVTLDQEMIWDRKAKGGFPEMKELKQLIRDQISPERYLGHSDSEERQLEN